MDQTDLQRVKSPFEVPSPSFPDYLRLHGRWQNTKPAIITDNGVLNWQDFNRAANRIAHGLQKKGLGPGDKIGVVMSNGLPMVLALFGIMKAGCCSVPINLSITDDAIATMLADSGAKALFLSEDQLLRIQSFRHRLNAQLTANLICAGHVQKSASPSEYYTEFDDWVASQESSEPLVHIPPNAPCNIIYSSGTTGMPKGIVHTFKGRLDWAYDMCVAYGYTAEARTLCTIGLYSNIMWAVMLATLLAGGTLFIHRQFNAQKALEDIENHKLTHTAMVPLQWQKLADAGASADNLKSIRSAITVGSAMHGGLKKQMLAFMPNAFIELYGLTEGILTAQSPAEMAERPDSVGKPILGCDIKILDDKDRECAAGTAGEIISRARFIMPGYFNRPDATADCQWKDDTGLMWLRTGDIGYLDEEGYLYIVDRKKDMILSGGQNIYPADIETILMRHDAVTDCAVIGVPDEKWGETPLAIVIPVEKDAAEPDTIRDWLNAQLGKQQRVHAVRFATELPRNPNGKILKRQLRSLYAKGQL